MATLNDKAGAVLHHYRVHACTDITGFGLIGHLLGMMKASGQCAVLDFDHIPLMAGVYDLAAAGVIPGGTRKNYAYSQYVVRYGEKLTEIQQLILNDAQTSVDC